MNKLKKILMVILIVISILGMKQVNAEDILVNKEAQTNFEIKDTIKRSVFNTLKNGIRLESRYSLKDEFQRNNNPIIVKNQLNSGSCWAFSFTSVLETSIAKQYNKRSKIFSPMHIEYVTAQMFEKGLGTGAGPRLSIAYATSGKGPIEEAEMPFESVYNDNNRFKSMNEVRDLYNKRVAAKVNETVEFSSIYKSKSGNQIRYYKDENYKDEYTQAEVNTERNSIKQHIKNYGAISADIHIDQEKYYNPSTAAYNDNKYSGKDIANHVVSIVGWDDNYSKNNFAKQCRPVNDGAYIVLNSYGTSWGKDGYMYISYEDACIEEGLIGIKNIKEYSNGEKDYDNIYQYDELGMNLGIPFGNEIYAASIYNRDASKKEYLNEVGVYVASTSGVKIYVDRYGTDFKNAELVASPKDALETGYHVIKLATPIQLKGDKFTVKVKYTNKEGAYLPLEANYRDYGIQGNVKFFNTAVANSGEAVWSNDGITWRDVNETVVVYPNKEQHSLKNSSACIKAFTTVEGIENNKNNTNYNKVQNEEPTGNIPLQNISLNKKNEEVQQGDIFNLSVSYSPSNATYKNVKWETSDSNIVTVSDTGIITAVSPGTAEIKVFSEENNTINDVSTVTVKEAISVDDNIYKDNGVQATTNNGNNSQQSSSTLSTPAQKENMLANIIIPNAGLGVFIFLVILIAVVMLIIKFIKFIRLKDIK